MAINSKNGITILELIITILIIGIIAGIGVPIYKGWIEHTRADGTKANIELIVSALKMYYIRGGYEPTYPITGLSGINSALNMELVDPRFTYIIEKPVGQSFCDIKTTYNDNPSKYIQWNLDLIDGDPDKLAHSDW